MPQETVVIQNEPEAEPAEEATAVGGAAPAEEAPAVEAAASVGDCVPTVEPEASVAGVAEGQGFPPRPPGMPGFGEAGASSTGAQPPDVYCCVCRDHINSRMSFWLPCCHAYHIRCISTWWKFKKDFTCPLCGFSCQGALGMETERREPTWGTHVPSRPGSSTDPAPRIPAAAVQINGNETAESATAVGEAAGANVVGEASGPIEIPVAEAFGANVAGDANGPIEIPITEFLPSSEGPIEIPIVEDAAHTEEPAAEPPMSSEGPAVEPPSHASNPDLDENSPVSSKKAAKRRYRAKQQP